MRKLILKTTKKTMALGLVLVLLFNISSESFAAIFDVREQISAQRELRREITTALESAKAESYSGEKEYKDCVEKGIASSCASYVNNLKKLLSDSASKSEKNNNIIEGKKTYKEYEKEVRQAIEKEYTKAEEEIEKEFREALWYSDLSWDNVNQLNYLEKQSKAQLNEWKENEEKNIKANYSKYEKDYQLWQAKTQAALEAQGREYLRRTSANLMKVYDITKGNTSNEGIIEILSALLNSEEKAGEFVEDRIKAEEILIKALQGEPCAYTAESRRLNKTGELLTNLAFINRNMYSTGANPIVLNSSAWDIIPATYKNPQNCQNAFYALEGLSHLKKSEKGVNAVLQFIKKNEKGLAASDKFNNSLVSGSAVLLKWKAYGPLKKYILAKMQEEKSNENTGFGGFGAIPGKVAYNGNYLGEISIYNQREDGTNAWEDLAALLTAEGSTQSKEILKSAVSNCKVVKEVLGKDKLECQTIMPFLYGALLYAPKVMDTAKPYQEAIPQYKEYLDAQGKSRQVDAEGIKRRNAYIENTFHEKMKSFGATLSSGLAGFLYYLKFEDIPTDAKMFLDNRLAKVYNNISAYNKNSERYHKLETNRAVVSILKYYGTLFDIWCFVSMAGLGAKALGGATALVKAKRILKGTQALTVAQRANILRQVAFIREGAQLRRFGRNLTAGMVNSANIGRKININAYLAEKNGMNPINYMLHNMSYQRGKNIALRSNILRVEGSRDFFNSSHYIAGVHNDIFRITRDVRRAGRIGVSELGKGGQVVSYVDKAKIKIFKEYTDDYIKGQEALSGAKAGQVNPELMMGQTTLLPREYLYSRKYKNILPFTQDNQFARTFNIGDKIYEGLRREGLYVVNSKTGEVYNDFVFNFDGYLNKNNLLIGRELGIRRPKPQVVNSFTQTAANNNFADITLLNPFNLITPSVNTLSGLTNPLKALVPSSSYLPKIPKLSLYYGNILLDSPFLNFDLNNISKNPKLFSKNISLGNEDITFIPGEELPEVKVEHNYDSDEVKPMFIASALNTLLKQLTDYTKANTLSPQETVLYNNIVNNIYKVLDDLPEAHNKYIGALEDTDFFTGDIPLIIFEGSNVQTVKPANVEGDVLVYALPFKKDYKKFIADKIKHLSAFNKDYTIYLSMHGDKGAKLGISSNTYTSIGEMLDIIEANKGNETINIITSACHSGAALKSNNLARKGINILLLSGRNDLCYTSDMQFVKINDLRSTYIEAVKNRYYGSYLVYDGKFFNVLADANSYLEKGDKIKEELSFLRKMYFKEGVFGDSVYQLLVNFPNHFKTPYLPFIKLYYLNITPSVFNPIFNVYEVLDDYIHILDPIKHQWEYVINTYDKAGALKRQESVVVEETNTEINNFLTDIAKKELKKEFPGWNYIENPKAFQRNFPLYPHIDDEFLSLNTFSKLKKDFPIIPTQHIKEKKAIIITKINKNIEKLKNMDISSFTRKKMEVYQEVLEGVKTVAKAPSKATIPQLKQLEKMSHLLTMEQPVLVLNGDDLNVFLPSHIPSNNFRVVDLSKEINHNQRIGTEIKDFARVFDKFTIWVDMHGNVQGLLLVSNFSGDKNYTRIAEIARITEANKGTAKVDLISGSCHGGAGYISRFKNSDINILILSGANEVCYQTDKNFLVYDDLPATYLNALEAGRYGSYLVYNGQVYNPIKEALSKAKDPTLKEELETLKDVFLNIDILGTELGKNIFKLLLNFDHYKLNTVFDNFEITKINGDNLHKLYNIPFVFNPVLPKDFVASSYLTKRNDVWNYYVRVYDQDNNLRASENVSFEKVNPATSEFIYEVNRKKLARRKNKKSALVTPKGKMSDLPLIKNPKTFTKMFNDYGLEQNLAEDLAKICFTGKNQKYTPVIFEKIKEFLEEGIEPKYIESMITALSDSSGFSLDLYNRAIALHEKHDIPLQLSSYFVNMGLSTAGYDPEVYDALDKLLENKFDFLETKKSWDILMSSERNKDSINKLGINRIDILSVFAKGGNDFDIDSWNNLIYISKRTEKEFSSFYNAMQYYIGKEEILKDMPTIIGIENVTKALKLSFVRYSNVFYNLPKVIGVENIPLLKKQLANMPLEKQLKIINTFSAMINLNEKFLNTQERIKLLENISDPQVFEENVNKIVFRKLGWQYTDRLGKIFDFSNNKYLMQILNAQNKFYVNLNSLYQIIRDNPGKSVSQIFDELPENKALAQMCAARNINYQAWRGYNPNDFITRKVLINGGKEPLTRMDITVRKVDMDNISQALITGNESRSCRSVGRGFCGEASPNLIRNKMVQQIEIVANGKAVGNALIYLAEVDGRTSIVVGSFVKKPPYFSYEVTKLVLDYVRLIRSQITKEEIPIYYSSFLPINNHYKFPLIEHRVMLIGDGFNEIFNSFTHQFVMPYSHQVDKVKLFTIENPKPAKKGDLSKEDILAVYAKKNVSNEDASEYLLGLCFEGEHKIFNPDVLEAEKYLLDMGMEPRFVKSIMGNLSIDGYFSKELYDKTLELYRKQGQSLITLSDLIRHCVENGAFNPKIYEKLNLLFNNNINFSKITFLESCKVNGIFREDLFEKGLKVSQVFDRYTPQVIADFTDSQGNFNNEYFEATYELLTRTQDLFPTHYDAIKTYVLSADAIQNAFDLLGTEATIKYISLNKDRYLNIFNDILDRVDKDNMIFLKEKLSPLPTQKKIEFITMLAGSINKKSSVLGKQGIRDLIDKISTPEVFKEEINRLVFKQLGLEYSAEMAKIFDFASTKYIGRILDGNAPFDLHLKNLFDDLKANIDKPIHQNFDLIPENIEFAKICAQNGINYQAWRSYNPNDFIERKVIVNNGKEPVIRDNLIVRKVDMDNVIKALTSGNESGACRAVGRGVCKDAAPELVRNKMVQQIEILRGDVVVSNALIYLTKVNDEVAIVIGSIIKKSPRYVSNEINELVADYVRKIRQDIGRPDIPIYMSSYLKVSNHYPMNWDRVVLLGSGDKQIFNSFTHDYDVPSRNKTNTVLLYQVDEGIKGKSNFVDSDYSSNQPKKDMLAQTAQKIEEQSYQNAVKKVKNQIKKEGIKSAGALAILCFEGEDLTFNPAVLETIKDLAKKNIEGVFIVEMIKALSPNNHFEPELYEKALELYENDYNMDDSIKMIKGSMENGVFNPKILEKFQELQGYYFPLSEYDFMKACFVDGVFKEDLYNKGISIAKEFTSSTPEILRLCKTEEGAFDDKLFENFVTLANNTAKSFSFEDPLLEYLIAGEGIKFSLEVIGVENTAKAINLNKARYKNVFLNLAGNMYKENRALLKAQLDPLPLEEKLSVLNQLSGILNKEKIPLTIQEEREVISQISDKEKFKETINRLSFKYFGFEYMPTLAKIFDFSGNRYLPLLFKGNNKFNLDFKRIYTEIKQLLTKSLKQGEPKNIHQLFDEIPENKAFAKICAERGIDYQAWRSYDPNDFIKREVLIRSNNAPTTKKELIARKVDMDDVIKGVTTGNESKACRAVAFGENCEAGPELVRNKMVQQVELLDNNEPVGNVLVYLAEVNGQTAIVMGTLMKKGVYNSHEIDELFIDYVRAMRSKMGRPDMPIYMSRIFSIDNVKNYPVNDYQVKLLGSGDNKIFNSFAHDFEVPADSKVNTIELYKVDEGVKGANDFVDTSYPRENNISSNNLLPVKFNFLDKLKYMMSPVFKVEIFRGSEGIRKRGTGFYIKYRNFPFILTARHLFKDADLTNIRVYNNIGFSEKAELLNLSDKSDLAILTLPQGVLDRFTPWTLALKEPRVGDDLVTIGYPKAKIKKINEMALLNAKEIVPDRVGNGFYLYEKAKINVGCSGSPICKANAPMEILGVVSAQHKVDPVGIGVPLPQIRTFLGETIKKILFTPDLSSKFLPLYPAFAKNYENVVNKFIYPSELAKKPSEKVKGTLTKKEQSIRLKRRIPEYFLTSPGYFRGMELNSLEELETILKEGLPVSKTSFDGVYFTPDIGLAFIYADNNGVKERISVLLKNINYKELTPINPPAEYASTRDVLPKEIGDVIVWTTIDGKEGWYKATLNEDKKLVLLRKNSDLMKKSIPKFFISNPGYFRGMTLNSLSEVETILRQGLPISKTSYDSIYFTPELETAFIYADNYGYNNKIPVLLKNVNYKDLTPRGPKIKTEYLSTRDVLPEEIGDVIVWTTIDGKEGWYKAILDEKNKLTLVYGDEVQTQIPTQEQQVETSWLAKLKTKIAAKRTAAYNKNPKNKAEFYLKEAKAAYEKENLDLAEDYYKLAIAQDPNNAKYYHELGRFYDDVYIDKYYQNLALENYNKAISLDPKNGEYYYSRALLKQYLLKDTPGAINDLAMSMKYGMKGLHTESLFKEWTEDYIKSQKSSQSQTLKPNFEPTAMETDYIPTSYTGANTEKPLNLKTDIKNGGNSLIANEDILYELSYEDYKGTPTLPDIERRIGSRLYRTAAKYKLKLNESDVIWIENNISKNSKHRDLFWLIDSTEPKNRNIETLNYIATFFNQFIDMPDIPRNVNKVLIALSGEYWAWYKKWVKDFGSRNFLIERWLEKAYTDKGIKGQSDFVNTDYSDKAGVLNKASLFPLNKVSYVDVFKYIKSTPVKWTEKTAENWLKERGFSKDDINDVLRACYKGKDFNSDIFELFVKGYKIKPDKSLSIMALSYSLGNNLLSYFSNNGIFNYQKYSKIYTIAKRAPQINFGAIIDYLDATPEQVEALCYAAENFPDVNPTEIMDLATTASLYFKTNNFNFGNYERIINWLKEGISFDSIKKIFETCLTKNYTIDEKTFSKIDNIAKSAIAKRDNFLPAKYRSQMNDVTIKNFIYHLAPEILEFLELTDEATLIAAMDYKMDKFEDFVKAGAMLRDNFRGAYNSRVKEQFFEIFYPEKSEKAQELERKILELKSRFSNTPAIELQNLKNEINTYTRQLRNLIKQGKEFSPQEKIEMIAIMSRFDGFELEELLESVKQVKTDGIKVWNKKIFDSLVSSLGPKYNMRVEEKLHLLQSPYLRHFFRTIYNKVSFGDRFYELLPLLSGEDFDKALDTLPHNIATKEIFDTYNLDYRKYTNPKVFPSETFYESNNLVEIRQVDMRDVSKSLFLGNESGACCAMGGTHPEYAVPYITNTFVGAIEVLVNGRSVGNTMIYPILVLGDKEQEIALLIDDLKIKAPYNQHKYLQKVVGVAKDIAKNIGIKNGKVYISDATIPDYEKSKLGTDTRFYLIGESGDSIWLNAIYNTSQAGSESTYKVTLVPCEKIK